MMKEAMPRIVSIVVRIIKRMGAALCVGCRVHVLAQWRQECVFSLAQLQLRVALNERRLNENMGTTAPTTMQAITKVHISPLYISRLL